MPDITGDFTYYLDDNAPISTLTAQAITDFGDSLNRTIAVGMHPNGFGGNYFQGLIYEPRVTVGALTSGQLLSSSGPRIVTSTATPQNLIAELQPARRQRAERFRRGDDPELKGGMIFNFG